MLKKHPTVILDIQYFALNTVLNDNLSVFFWKY